jgi:restriction system protein
MAEITRQRTGELLRKLFEILKQAPDGLPAIEALTALENSVKLTPYESGDYQSGGRRFEKIVRFATVDCVKAGWLQKNKGKWSLTDAGWSAYQAYKDPAMFYSEAVKLYRQWKAAQLPDADEVIVDIVDSGTKNASITFETAEEQAWSEIEAYLKAMPPYEFQELVAELLRAMGYEVSWIAPPGKDGGIDIIALPDPLGTRPPRIKVQVKRQQAAATVDVVRSFMALLGESDVGLFVSLGGFTKDAAYEARTQEKRRITLVDLERLFDLWVKHYSTLTDEARQRLPLKPIYFLAPEA